MSFNNFNKLTLSKNPRFNSGICLVCGEHMDLLLHIHAESHGFKDAYDQIKYGYWLEDWRRNDNGKIFRADK